MSLYVDSGDCSWRNQCRSVESAPIGGESEDAAGTNRSTLVSPKSLTASVKGSRGRSRNVHR